MRQNLIMGQRDACRYICAQYRRETGREIAVEEFVRRFVRLWEAGRIRWVNNRSGRTPEQLARGLYYEGIERKAWLRAA